MQYYWAVPHQLPKLRERTMLSKPTCQLGKLTWGCRKKMSAVYTSFDHGHCASEFWENQAPILVNIRQIPKFVPVSQWANQRIRKYPCPLLDQCGCLTSSASGKVTCRTTSRKMLTCDNEHCLPSRWKIRKSICSSNMGASDGVVASATNTSHVDFPREIRNMRSGRCKIWGQSRW